MNWYFAALNLQQEILVTTTLIAQSSALEHVASNDVDLLCLHEYIMILIRRRLSISTSGSFHTTALNEEITECCVIPSLLLSIANYQKAYTICM